MTNPFAARRVLTVGLILGAIVAGANGAGQQCAAASGPADPAPPDYCKQDPDWYLCRHNHEPPRTVPPTVAPAPMTYLRVGTRGPERATTSGSVPR